MVKDEDFGLDDFDIEEQEPTVEEVNLPGAVDFLEEDIDADNDTDEDVTQEDASTDDESEIAEPKQKSKAKASKKKKKEKVEVPVIPIKDKPPLNLYIVVDRKIPNLVSYLRERGLMVSNVFENINEAKDMLILQGENCRLVIMETGSGKFTGTATRREIVDIIGLSDENTQVSVFYTDSIVKSETTRIIDKKTKRIDWVKYTTTLEMAVRVLAYEENYVLGDGYDDIEEVDENKIMGMRLEKTKLDPKFEKGNMSNGGFTSKIIEEQVVEAKDNLLPSYDIRV